MKGIVAFKNKDLNEDPVEVRHQSPERKQDEQRMRIEDLGRLCEEQKEKEIDIIDKKLDDLKEKYLDLMKRPCDPSPELQIMLFKQNSLS